MSINGNDRWLMLQPSPRPVEMAMAFHELGCLLAAGVSLSDALEDLAEMAGPRGNQRIWAGISRSVRSGHTLSDSYVRIANRPDRAVLALIKAGEANGQLDQGCKVVYEHLQWHLDLRQRLVTLLLYPLFTLFVLLGVSGFLFVSVVPSVKGFLMESTADLAWHTLVLMSVSEWFSQHYAYALVISLGLSACLLILLLASERVRWVGGWCFVRLPLMGSLVVDLSLSRYCAVAARLYSSGVPIETAVALAEASISSRYIRSEMAGARQRMLSGMSLAESLRSILILPGMFIRLVAVGESAGRLADALTRLGEQQNKAAEASIKRMEQLIGPVLLMFVGTILLWIVVSVLGPVYELAIKTVAGAP